MSYLFVGFQLTSLYSTWCQHPSCHWTTTRYRPVMPEWYWSRILHK